MNNRFLIIVSIVVILVIGLGAYFFLAPSSTEIPPPPPGLQDPFGTPSGTLSPSTTPHTGPLLILETKSGEQTSVPDFTSSKQSFPIGRETYYFITNNQETMGEDAAFDIVYGTDSSISIGLFKEPLGATRLEAESALRQLLKLPTESICALYVSVAVPNSVNQFYAGKNLGLSFCPGATALPN